MGTEARADFLARFRPEGQGVGFAVLGGVFAEGVDLPGSLLIGAFIATLGLPPVSVTQDHFRARLDKLFGADHGYADLVPAMQRVVQAAGRVLRTPEDRGWLWLLETVTAGPRSSNCCPHGGNWLAHTRLALRCRDDQASALSTATMNSSRTEVGWPSPGLRSRLQSGTRSSAVVVGGIRREPLWMRCSVSHPNEPLQHVGGPLRKDIAEHLAALELVLADHGAVSDLPAAVDRERQPTCLGSLPLEAYRSVGIDLDRRQTMAGRQAEKALGLREGGGRRPSPATGLDQGLCLVQGRGKEWVHHGIVSWRHAKRSFSSGIWCRRRMTNVVLYVPVQAGDRHAPRPSLLYVPPQQPARSALDTAPLGPALISRR